MALESSPGERWLALGTVGVPHLIVRVEDIEAVDVLGRGKQLRWDPPARGGRGQCELRCRPVTPGQPWLIRTFERGVEGETLACGTGTVAAALALAARGEASLPLSLRSRGGPELTVRANLQGSRASDVWLGGQGRLVFRGVWEGLED